ncbi:SpoIIE family protein phosphatase [Streptomyces sp. NPDC048521]|uniref:SpoIIE family protein phosphatase n=1 Tax=Streptomyces sp. NPDC048521 TaxID=3365566 RepID=UPI00371CDAE9
MLGSDAWERQPDRHPAVSAFVAADAAGTITAWGPGAQELLGFTDTEAVGRPLRNLLNRSLSDLTAQVPDDRACEAVHTAMRHKDGHTVEARLRAHSLRRAGGDPEWIVTAEQADPPPDTGAEAGQFSQWTLSQLLYPAAYYDQEARLVGANREWLRLLGVTEEQARGRRLVDILPGEPYQDLAKAYREVLRSGVAVHHEISVRAPGEARPRAWSVHVTPLTDSTGTVRGVSSVGLDITAQYRARQRLIFLDEAGRRIGTSLDIVRTAQELADVAVDGFADFVTVDLLDPVFRAEAPSPLPRADEPVVLRRAGRGSVLAGAVPGRDTEAGEPCSFPHGSPPARALDTGRPAGPLGQAPWAADESVHAERAGAGPVHSALVVPLCARGTTLGVACFHRHRNPDAYDEDDVLLAQEITNRAATCLDNAHRFTREHKTALVLQRSLLPAHHPREAAVEVASRYRPAGTTAGVGGDWFDVIPLSGGRVALVVGDVVGHGLYASATMGRLRTAVRTLADVDLAPDELLTRLDDVVLRLQQEQSFEPAEGTEPDTGIWATCLYAVYDPTTRLCTLARAGHPEPAVVRPDGTVDFLDLPAGPPLGLGSLPFESVEAALDEGSLLVLYTDGLVGSRSQSTDIGTQRLRQALAHPGPSLEQTCDTILDRVLPDSPDDDVALLVARTRAFDASQVFTWDVPVDPAAVAVARQKAAEQLTAWGREDALFVTELVISELVTNAIRHAQGPIQLRLINSDSLTCEVSDASNTAPHLRRARTFDEGGRGLLLVAQLTQRWGTRQSASGKTIWAEQSEFSAL